MDDKRPHGETKSSANAAAEGFIPHLAKTIRGRINAALGRVQVFALFVLCMGILGAYLMGMYATGTIHSASRWMGAMLACSSVVGVLQQPTSRDSLRVGFMRVLGTFLGALIAYVYLLFLPFSLAGMLGTVFLLEMFLMIFNIYNNGHIATLTLLIIMLVSQMSPDADPAVNCLLRFSESAVGVAVGVVLLWTIERWNAWRRRLLHMGASPDGSSVDMDTMPLRWGHLRVLTVASLGQFTGAALSTIVGVVIPLMQIALHPELPPLVQGCIAAASLAGITVGAVLFGFLSDRYGYLTLFRLCPVVVLAASLCAFFSEGAWQLAASLFVMGLGIGGDYSLDGDYISEIMPRRLRLFMVGVAKAFSAPGNILAAAACYLLLRRWSDAHMWHSLLLLVSLLAAVMISTRIRFAQSPAWLAAHNRRDEALRAVRYFLGQDVAMGTAVQSLHAGRRRGRVSLRDMFRRGTMRKVVFSGIPWACEGVGVYGIGIFLPVLIMAVGFGSDSADAFARTVRSVETSIYVNLFVLAGFAAGLAAVNRLNHVRMQTWGFILCAAGLGLLLAAYALHLPAWVSVAGFMIFELFINAGPHLVTFILPSQIFSVEERSTGAGLAAATGKTGAVAGVFFFPLLMDWGGVEAALAVTIALQIIGAAVTAALGRKILPSEGWNPAPVPPDME